METNTLSNFSLLFPTETSIQLFQLQTAMFPSIVGPDSHEGLMAPGIFLFFVLARLGGLCLTLEEIEQKVVVFLTGCIHVNLFLLL